MEPEEEEKEVEKDGEEKKDSCEATPVEVKEEDETTKDKEEEGDAKEENKTTDGATPRTPDAGKENLKQRIIPK